MYSQGDGSGGYLAFLGRLTRNKGVDVALRAARLAGRQLVMGGPIPNEPGAQAFFEAEVKPAVERGDACWLGPLDDRGKQNLLGNAEALLFPIRWDEPFGLVMTEALACGTPVIATAGPQHRRLSAMGSLVISVIQSNRMPRPLRRRFPVCPRSIGRSVVWMCSSGSVLRELASSS